MHEVAEMEIDKFPLWVMFTELITEILQEISQETMKVIRHESLGIYIYANPKNKREQDFNEVMAEKAEAIRCRRFESVVNERYDFFDKYKLKADFLEYFRLTELVAEINVELLKSTFSMHEVAEMEIDKFPLWVMFTELIT